MPSPAQLHANRLNALRSTGPRSVRGKRRSSQNALTTGLFSRHLVLSSLGEAAEDLASLRRSVITALAPVGAVEREVADRIALLMWRLRRPARCEAAAMAATIDCLAPDPATLTGEGIDACTPLSDTATPAERLARVRAEIQSLPARVDEFRGAATALAADDAAGIETKLAWVVLGIATRELDWPTDPGPWPAVLVRTGCLPERVRDIAWDGALLRTVLRVVAEASKRDPGVFIAAVSERLHADANGAEQRLVELRTEETRLVTRLTADRDRDAARAIYIDEAMIQRIARAEGSLSRELERALAMLDRLRDLRTDEGDLSGGLGSFCREDG